MERTVTFQDTRYGADSLRDCIERVIDISNGEVSYDSLKIEFVDGSWVFDKIEEFYEEYREKTYKFWHSVLGISTYTVGDHGIKNIIVGIRITTINRETKVTVSSSSRDLINQVITLFHQHRERNMLSPLASKEESSPPSPTIFIGHGHSPQWRDLKDHLTDHHSYKVEVYESGARAGHAVRDVLSQLLNQNSFAILVMTAEDMVNDDGMRARQNVVHEAGLFQGRLGFDRAIVLEEEGVEMFSNLDGVNRIRFSSGNIRETYGEVLATLRREFGDLRLLIPQFPRARTLPWRLGSLAGVGRAISWTTTGPPP